jgi:ABC-type transporter Mla MlaB component
MKRRNKPSPATSRATGSPRSARQRHANGAARRAQLASQRLPQVAGGRLSLTSDCTIAEATALKAGLMQLLSHESAVTLDGSAVQRIDTACLQLLAAFVLEREARGRHVEWQEATDALTSSARTLGLLPVLRLDRGTP